MPASVMEDEKGCSTRWPRYAVYVYCVAGMMVGAGLIGGGVYLFKEEQGFNLIFEDILHDSLGEGVNTMMFIKISSIMAGCVIIISGMSLGICGAYKMNRSCVATYTAFVIFAMVMCAAVGLTLTGFQERIEDDLQIRSNQQSRDQLIIGILMSWVMYVTLAVSAFQMIGVVLTCCLQKAIEDVSKD